MTNQPDSTPAEASTPCRVLRVKFKRTARVWRTTDQARRSMAALWNHMVRIHKRVRRAHWK